MYKSASRFSQRSTRSRYVIETVSHQKSQKHKKIKKRNKPLPSNAKGGGSTKSTPTKPVPVIKMQETAANSGLVKRDDLRGLPQIPALNRERDAELKILRAHIEGLRQHAKALSAMPAARAISLIRQLNQELSAFLSHPKIGG